MLRWLQKRKDDESVDLIDEETSEDEDLDNLVLDEEPAQDEVLEEVSERKDEEEEKELISTDTQEKVQETKLPSKMKPVLEIPRDGATSQFNDSSLGHAFQWSGASPGKILFSRLRSMKAISFDARVKG